MRPYLVLIVASTVLVSGCVSDDDGGGDGVASGDLMTGDGNNTTAPAVFEGTGTVTAAVGPLAGGQGGLTFDVGEGATLIFAELAWDDPVADLDLALASPSAGETQGVQNYDHQANGGTPGAPDSPHSLTVESPEAGGWFGSAFANGGGANIQYRIVATVFYLETSVPEGYSAL